jgi:tetratricopeptide (TPR) repeat protein
LGRRTDAINAFQQAIKSKPDQVPSWYNLGLTFYLDGQYKKAREALRTPEKLDYEMAAKLRAQF